MDELIALEQSSLEDVISEFFFYVYHKYYRENGFMQVRFYDPEVLKQMGLPFDADQEAVKKRFRELAKKHHPDTGGNHAKFIELMDMYNKLNQ